jgi:hypothetical protein
LRRLTVAVLVVLGALAQLAAPAAAAASHGRKITDTRYAISFHLPPTWKHSKVTTSTSRTTKVLVEDLSGAKVVGFVQVQVIAGRNTNASAIATGLLESAPGADILGSSVAKFPFGKAEQLRFRLEAASGEMYGIADAFRLHAHTYLVAFDAPDPAVNATARSAVLSSWGT